MKKVIIILILGLNLILLQSCAKPKVLNVTLPNDNKLNCEKLEDALDDAQEFRKKAYETDNKALEISRFWIKRHEELPFHYICTLCISLSHSENIEDQNIVHNYIKTNLYGKHFNKYKTIYNTLYRIHNNHRNRIIFFSRIPERNIILNRPSTEKELVYMNNI